MKTIINKLFSSKLCQPDEEITVEESLVKGVDKEEEEYFREFYRQKSTFYPYNKKEPVFSEEESKINVVSPGQNNEEIIQTLRKSIQEEIYFAITSKGSIELSVTKKGIYYVAYTNNQDENEKQIWYSKDPKKVWSSCKPFFEEFGLAKNTIEDLKLKLDNVSMSWDMEKNKKRKLGLYPSKNK